MSLKIDSEGASNQMISWSKEHNIFYNGAEENFEKEYAGRDRIQEQELKWKSIRLREHKKNEEKWRGSWKLKGSGTTCIHLWSAWGNLSIIMSLLACNELISDNQWGLNLLFLFNG